MGSTGGVDSREGRLQLVFRCSARGDPENWVWGNRESGEGPRAASLVFWPKSGFHSVN